MNHSDVARLRQVTRRNLRGKRASSRTDFLAARRWFMVELGLQVGLRVSEMVSLCHKDLLLDGERSSVVVVGKGGKRRAVWVGSAFKSMFMRFSKEKSLQGFSINSEQPLLCTATGKSLTKRILQRDFERLIHTAGLPAYYHIHCLRHTYTTFLLRASNNNYRFAQQQLGHASIRTTQVYAAVVESDGRQALERLYAQI